MALDFDSAGSGRRVDHGSGTNLDNLPASNFTVWAWIYQTTDAANSFIYTKDNSFPSGWVFLTDNGSGNGELRMIVFRTDTNGGNWTDFEL